MLRRMPEVEEEVQELLQEMNKEEKRQVELWAAEAAEDS
jgi:hypothetical protein